VGSDDRAWILFQLGNCLRDSDPSAGSGQALQAARNAYRRLIAEYPDSLWTDLAKARESLIDWYLKDDPLTLIKQHPVR
jgi:hypothetical protein